MSAFRESDGKLSMARIGLSVAIGVGVALVVGQALDRLHPSTEGYEFLKTVVEWCAGWAGLKGSAASFARRAATSTITETLSRSASTRDADEPA